MTKTWEKETHKKIVSSENCLWPAFAGAQERHPLCPLSKSALPKLEELTEYKQRFLQKNSINVWAAHALQQA
jgi:hypothetical protein